jgi:glycogen debranching enzyme
MERIDKSKLEIPKSDLVKPNLQVLKNQIDFTRVPFSDRGSRLMVFLASYQSEFYIKLGERLTSIEPGIDTYRGRPPFIRNLRLVDANGEMLDFAVTAYPHMMILETSVGEFRLAFADTRTLSFGLPPATAGIKFHVTPQYWKASEWGGAFKSIRDLAYTTNGEILCNQITPEEGGYSVEFIVSAGEDRAINLFIGRDISAREEILPGSIVRAAAEKRWSEWFEAVPAVAEQYLQTYAYAWWIMGNNLVKPQGSIVYEAMMPSMTNYVGIWLWDSAMHALAFRHIDPELARDQIRAMLAHQLPDGMLPDAIYDEGVITELEWPIIAEVTKPPILAWAALKLHETAPDLEFLKEIYIPLVRCNAWWFSMNDDDNDGLVQYNHPYSSGLDDNPLWDFGMPVESPDLNTYLCVEMGSLAIMAQHLGMDAEAAMWRRRASAIVQRMMVDLWDDQAGIFRATREHWPIPVVTPFNLYPLWTGQLPVNIRQRVLQHLTDPEMFWGEYALPSVARNDPRYDPRTMWRGPVWVNINYFMIEALNQIGELDLARVLREKTLNLIMRHPSPYEYYDSETGDPPPKAAEAFGWTAAVFIDLAIAASRDRSIINMPALPVLDKPEDEHESQK